MSHETPSIETTRLKRQDEADELLVEQLRFSVIDGSDKGRDLYSTSARTVLGTDPIADLRLTDVTVSRFHCEVLIEGSRAVVRDLGSTNETRIHGVAVQVARIHPGDILSMGRTRIRVEPVSEPLSLRISPRASFGRMVGRSPAARRVFALLEQAAASDATVLLTGETGTGKEVAAESLHRASHRSEGPFVVVDCGAIPPALLESELFGHERGAFTGADRSREGAFEAANKGTIFLDEIGELALDLQPKLLRVLESREVRRIGSNTRTPIDVRIIAATNRDLRTEVNARRFRGDLYFRLAVLAIGLPSLRERASDLPLLVESLLEALGASSSPQAAILRTRTVSEALVRHAWPGNIRELRNYVERSLALQEEASLELVTFGDGSDPPIDPSEPLAVARERFVNGFERRYLEASLRAHDGNVSAAARAAGVDRTHFHRLMRRYGLRS